MDNKSKTKTKKKKKETKEISSINLLNNRIIYLSGNIDELNASKVIEALLRLDTVKSKEDIKLYINSGGGSVAEGLAIIDTMNLVKNDVSTICIGKCASMAAVVLSAGARGKRFVMPNSEVMIHEASTYTYGKMEEVKNDFEHSTKVNKRLLKILAENTGQTIKKITKDTLADNWFTSEEAIKYGLADKVLTND